MSDPHLWRALAARLLKILFYLKTGDTESAIKVVETLLRLLPDPSPQNIKAAFGNDA